MSQTPNVDNRQWPIRVAVHLTGHYGDEWKDAKRWFLLTDSNCSMAELFHLVELWECPYATVRGFLEGYMLDRNDSIELLRDGDRLTFEVFLQGPSPPATPESSSPAASKGDSVPELADGAEQPITENSNFHKPPAAFRNPPGPKQAMNGTGIKRNRTGTAIQKSSEEKSSSEEESSTSEESSSSEEQSSSEEDTSDSDSFEENQEDANGTVPKENGVSSKEKIANNHSEMKPQLKTRLENGKATSLENGDKEMVESSEEESESQSESEPDSESDLDVLIGAKTRQGEKVPKKLPAVQKISTASKKPSRSALRKRRKRILIREGILPRPQKKQKTTEEAEVLPGPPISRILDKRRGRTPDPAHAEFLATGHIHFHDQDSDLGKEYVEEAAPSLPDSNPHQGNPEPELTFSIPNLQNADMEGEEREKQGNAFENSTDGRPDSFYEQLPQISGMPDVGSQIAYRILELDQSYCPKESEWREGCVSSIDDSCILEVQPSDAFRKRHKANLHSQEEEEDAMEDDLSPYDENGVLHTELTQFSQLRLITQNSLPQNPDSKRPEKEHQPSLKTAKNSQQQNKSCATPGAIIPKIKRIQRGNSTQNQITGPPISMTKENGLPNPPPISNKSPEPKRKSAKGSIANSQEASLSPKNDANLANRNFSSEQKISPISPEIAEALASKKASLAPGASTPNGKPAEAIQDSALKNSGKKGTGGPGAVKARPGANASALGKLLSALREENALS